MTATTTTGRGTVAATPGTVTITFPFPALGGDATYTVPADRADTTRAAFAALGFNATATVNA